MTDEARDQSAEAQEQQAGSNEGQTNSGQANPGASAAQKAAELAEKIPFDYQLILDRVKAIITNPKETWPQIRDEQISVKDLYLKYFLVLAAVPAIAKLIGNVFAGRFSFALTSAIITYIISLGFLYIGALIVEKIAGTCGGETDVASGVKFLGFAAVPTYIAGILDIIPHSPAGLLSLIGLLISLYSLKLLWDGVPVMTGVQDDSRIKFLALCLVCFLAVGLIVGAIFGPYLFVSAMAGVQY